MPVLNEGKIIESKILHSLSFSRHVVVVEGSIPQTYDVKENGLSSDETSEILKQYADRITYLPVGRQSDRSTLQNHALNYIHKNFPDTEILHRTDADEFISDKALKYIDREFEHYQNKDWLIYTDLVNLVDGTRYRPNDAPKGNTFPFCKGLTLCSGMYHERFYRYRPDMLYRGTAHALSDWAQRPFYAHPDYYFNRNKVDWAWEPQTPGYPIRILHYKYIDGFKRLLKAEMSYLVEDEHMIPNSDANFNRAKERLKKILDGQCEPIQREEHCQEVIASKWFKYEKAEYNWNITLYEVLS
jgi:hypothetical protein